MGTPTWKLRLPVATRLRWQVAADAAGMSLSEFVRLAVDEKIDIASSHAPAEVIERRQVEIEADFPPDIETPPMRPAPPPTKDPYFRPDFKKGGT